MKLKIITISVSEHQDEALRQLKKETGQPVSSLVRQGINLILGVYGHGSKAKERPLD